MKLTTASLLAYIQMCWQNGVTIASTVSEFGITHTTAHRHLNTLLAQWQIEKKGKVPRVIYVARVANTPLKNHSSHPSISPLISRTLETERYQIEKNGSISRGVSGFLERCQQRKLDPVAASQRRYGHVLHVDSMTDNYGIDATKKLHDYGANVIDHLRYASIYAYPEFGKTKAGTLMEIAKVQPSSSIFDELLAIIMPYYQAILRDVHVDALCFAQPTTKRTLQIMQYTQKILGGNFPIIPLSKVPGYFPPQKSLKTREDRITNAQASFMIEYLPKKQKKKTHYHHVLIIDDAVGSGATFVEIARKIKEYGYAEHVSALSITGTANGIFDDAKKFEVISHV